MLGIVGYVFIVAIIFCIMGMFVPGLKVDDLGTSIKAGFCFAAVTKIFNLFFGFILVSIAAAIVQAVPIDVAKVLVIICYFIFHMISSFMGFGMCHKYVPGFVLESNKALIITTVVYAVINVVIAVVMQGLFTTK